MDATEMREARRMGRAAKQLRYHRERVRWMERRMAENEYSLVSYLQETETETALLPGGFVVSLMSDGSVEVGQRIIRSGYEQLVIEESEASA